MFTKIVLALVALFGGFAIGYWAIPQKSDDAQGGGLGAARAGNWTAIGNMNTVRRSMGIAALGHKIYVVGGSDSQSLLSSAEVYDPLTDAWTAIADMSMGRTGCAAAATSTYLFVIGGDTDSGITSTGERYDPATNTWSAIASMNTKRANLGVSVGSDGLIYAVGGGDQHYLSTAERYNPSVNTWEDLSNMTMARGGMGMATMNGVLYAMGGQTPAQNLANTVEAFNYSTCHIIGCPGVTWQSVSSMATGRSFLGGAARAASAMYAVGGDPVGTAEVYDPATDAWAALPTMAIARRQLGVVALNDRLYAVGGTIFTSTALATGESLALGAEFRWGWTCPNIPVTYVNLSPTDDSSMACNVACEAAGAGCCTYSRTVLSPPRCTWVDGGTVATAQVGKDTDLGGSVDVQAPS